MTTTNSPPTTTGQSIYRRALGVDFDRLHPKIQQRFDFAAADGIGQVGRGVMTRVWRGAPYTLPFLFLGTWRNIMFPERGRNIPFTIENYAYRDTLGRETVTWVRTFQLSGGRQRRFDATMIYSPTRRCIVDYMGSHQHLAVDIDLAVDERTRGLRLRSGEQRFYEGPIAFRFPMLFSGVADVVEWYDDALGRYRIDVRVTNRRWGPLFGYSGAFDLDVVPTHGGGAPEHVRPRREERRE